MAATISAHRAVMRSVRPALPPTAPLELVRRTNAELLPEFVDLRVVRLTASRFAFLRGSVAAMAADLAHTPSTGLNVWLCGDAEALPLGDMAVDAVTIAFGSAELFGVSFALGAFFAGMMLAESELSSQAAAETLPLRDAFAVLFFVSVGMLLNPAVLVDAPTEEATDRVDHHQPAVGDLSQRGLKRLYQRRGHARRRPDSMQKNRQELAHPNIIFS